MLRFLFARYCSITIKRIILVERRCGTLWCAGELWLFRLNELTVPHRDNSCALLRDFCKSCRHSFEWRVVHLNIIYHLSGPRKHVMGHHLFAISQKSVKVFMGHETTQGLLVGCLVGSKAAASEFEQKSTSRNRKCVVRGRFNIQLECGCHPITYFATGE